MKGTDCLGWIIVNIEAAAVLKDVGLRRMKLSVSTWQSAPRLTCQCVPFSSSWCFTEFTEKQRTILMTEGRWGLLALISLLHAPSYTLVSDWSEISRCGCGLTATVSQAPSWKREALTPAAGKLVPSVSSRPDADFALEVISWLRPTELLMDHCVSVTPTPFWVELFTVWRASSMLIFNYKSSQQTVNRWNQKLFLLFITFN